MPRSGGPFQHQWRADFRPWRSRTKLRHATREPNEPHLLCERASVPGQGPGRAESPDLQFVHYHRAVQASRFQGLLVQGLFGPGS